MPSPYLKKVDSSEFEARFSNESGIRYSDVRNSSVTYEEIKPFINRLPPREQDLIELYYCDDKNQKDIAKMFGVTQGAISSRLSRAFTRLRFIRDIPKISVEDVEDKLQNYFDEIEIEIIVGMMQTTCQSRTAALINERHGLRDKNQRMTQVKVRHRFEKCISRLQDLMNLDPELKEYCQLLKFIKKNLYKLHEVRLPHFDRGECAVFSLTN